MIRVLIADDHLVVAQALGCLLKHQGNIEVLASVTTGNAAVDTTHALRPDVVLMDYRMPDLDGIEATRLIVRRFASVRVVMLSRESDARLVARAIRAGASGYVTKRASAEELVKAISAAHSGKRHIDPRVVGDIVGALARGERGDPISILSARERQILQLLTLGRTNAEIARLLSLSARTVETYRARLMKKLEIRDLPALVRFAIRHGLSTLE
jgi:DNA-binding NarL/FixJ family response regulator